MFVPLEPLSRLGEMSAERNQYEDIDRSSSLDLSDSQELIVRARDGCDDALGELIRSLQGYLMLVANQETSEELRTKVAPSDLVQCVLIRAQQNIADFRGSSRETLLGWLRTILNREIVSAHRKYLISEKRNARREVLLSANSLIAESLLNEDRSPHSDAVMREEAARLRSAVERLPKDYRDVVILRNWERWPFAQIGPIYGQEHGCSEETMEEGNQSTRKGIAE